LVDGLREDLVVDVRRVAHERHPQTAVREPAAQLIEDDRGAHVPDVGRALHGGTADVDPHLAVADGLEGDQVSGRSAVQSYHARKCTETAGHDAPHGPTTATARGNDGGEDTRHLVIRATVENIFSATARL